MANHSRLDSLSTQADIRPGNYLLNAYSPKKLRNVEVTVYQLQVDGGVDSDWNRSRFTASAAYSLDREHGTPVATAGTMQVVAATSLSQSIYTWGKRVTPVEKDTLKLDPANAGDRAKLEQFVQSCLRRAVPSDTYDYEFINEIVRTEPEFSSDQFAAHPKYEVGVQVTNSGTVLAHVESGYTIRSTSTLDEIYSTSDDPKNIKAAHVPERYSNEGKGWIHGWSDLHYNDYIENAGASIADMHEEVADEAWRQRLIDENPRLLKIKYGNKMRNQAPHYLKLSPRLEQVKEEDYDFFSRFMSRRSMMPDEKFSYSQEFINDLQQLPVLELELDPGPTNKGYDHLDIRGAHNRLEFADNSLAASPPEGLRKFGVYKSPGQYRVGLLAPNRLDDLRNQFIPRLVAELGEIGAPAAVTGYGYDLGTTSDYTPLAHELRDETDVVVVVVPDKEKVDEFPGIEDPHHEIKRTLMRRGIPTQMVTRSTAKELIDVNAGVNHNKMLNILSAVVGKAGGTPWQVGDMPGETDAFMGLDVSRDPSSGQHSGASASVVLADGTTYAAESTVSQAGEKFSPEDVKRFVRDLVIDFAAEEGKNIDRLCIMRDGKVQEDIDALREGLSELSAEIDIVGVRKSGQPRVAEYTGSKFQVAYKGIAFVDRARDHAIVHGSGRPEIRTDNAVGTPQTYRVTKDSGPTDIETLARQAYWLSEAHIGSPVKSSRLPIPIDYADKAAAYVRDDIVSPGSVIKGPAYI